VSGYPPGAIPQHVRILRPHIGIITTVGTDHYKSFRGLEAVAKEKCQLVQNLSSHGTAILNADDAHVRAMAARTRAKVFTFGRSLDADLRAAEISSVWPDRLSLTVVHEHEKEHVHTQLVGEHWVTSVLAAMACGIVCGVNLNSCARMVERFRPVFGRYSVHKTPGGAVYVLDTRKAPFWTIPSGLAFIKAARAPRKTIVFGTISDYAGASSPKYRKIAREALQVADRVMFVGPHSSHLTRLQQEHKERLFAFQCTYQASSFLAEHAVCEELIYVKSSISDHLERIALSQVERVVCWRERCGVKEVHCGRCTRYPIPYRPPFGLDRECLGVS